MDGRKDHGPPRWCAGDSPAPAQQPHPGAARTLEDVAAGASSKVSDDPSAAAGPRRIRRRMRMITSCLECRRRKLKCNRSNPCTHCLKFGRDCRYLGPKLDEAGQLRLTEIKEKVGSLERQLERDVATPAQSRAAAQQRILADDVDDDELAEERNLEVTELVAIDIAYEDDVDDRDDIIDLGVQVGKMRITERIGGLSRPRLSEELTSVRLAAGLASKAGSPGAGSGPGLPGQLGPPPPAAEGSIPDFLKPGPEYIPPSSGFFFGMTVNTPSLEELLIPKPTADQLVQQYFRAVHPIARVVHRPSFEVDYQSFWDEVYSNYEPRPSLQGVVFAALFSAVVSMSESAVLQMGLPKNVLVDRLKLGTEASLGKANFLRTTRLETMQAFIMYMIPLCRAEVSRAHSVLVGAAVRMAECMGLHRDGDAYGLSPLDTHVRRLIWHQLCFLDIRTCEAQGPRPAIRRDDYDTKLPINCEEKDLVGAVVPPEPAECWTTTLFPLIRFEINEMMRIIWMDRRRLEARKMTLTAVLTKIETFRGLMLDKYERFLDDRVPTQRYAKLVMHLLLYRLHAMVLHPYHANASSPMPHRLNNVLIMSGIMIVELSIQLETDYAFHDWAWYLGAFSQYHIALLLATEVYYRPQNREAPRIWACLDHVFGLERSLPPEAKALRVLGEIMHKTGIYQSMRKVRAPTGMTRAMLGKTAVEGTRGSSGSSNRGGTTVTPPRMPQQPSVQTPMVPMVASAKTGPVTMPAAPPMVFAGIANGEALWGVPPPTQHPDFDMSDNSSESSEHKTGIAVSSAMMPAGLDAVEWEAINALFPHDPSTGELRISGFHDPALSLGMNWRGL